MTLKLVLLDRDGVINLDSPDYIKTPEEWQPIAGAMEAVALLQQHVTVAVCTNQSGVGRGLYGWGDFAAVQDEIARQLAERGAAWNAVYASPFPPGDWPMDIVVMGGSQGARILSKTVPAATYVLSRNLPSSPNGTVETL